MEKVYTTQELIKILESERQACLNGKRRNLSATISDLNPVIDKIIKPDAVQKFTAYQDFQVTIHRYQIEHQVSGLVWHHLTIHGKTLKYPVVDERLIAIPHDMRILREFKSSAIDFWQQVTEGMDLYLMVNYGKDYRKILPTEVKAIAQTTEWASLCKWEKSDFLEIILQLGWGQPAHAADRRGWPHAGSEYIHAVKPNRRPIC
ncbi:MULTISPECIES: hypothetical protein [Planktothricoides]|uniref:Uncharacterized protein n=2 Tax=Planktothricoides raciborskii TaxID=132608 RepID=A0AAU8JLY4_9CYAN|nr:MULTISPECIES: hypothetical protein [Planktothricoides]KOR34423.1 hypothetical protein AM228_23985 [Planktothricoides sp. SR001]MBD2547722.1 hypothetical protein [Planktothricoides raciborskii FACHB-1370]MBD2586160.1 hypothetical protein [Planktothricoides raciborskii FACHB-1261]